MLQVELTADLVFKFFKMRQKLYYQTLTAQFSQITDWLFSHAPPTQAALRVFSVMLPQTHCVIFQAILLAIVWSWPFNLVIGVGAIKIYFLDLFWKWSNICTFICLGARFIGGFYPNFGGHMWHGMCTGEKSHSFFTIFVQKHCCCMCVPIFFRNLWWRRVKCLSFLIQNFFDFLFYTWTERNEKHRQFLQFEVCTSTCIVHIYGKF